MYRQSWDTVNRPKYRGLAWSESQSEALRLIAEGYSHEDEDSRHNSSRFLYIKGRPGSGKSAVLLEAAIRACASIRVLIVCPTGVLVHSFKARLPEVEGIENISVDTIHGVLNYKRPGADSKVQWAPPSALRRIDLILCDEGSQYEDQEWDRLFQVVKEQPHSPFVGIVADFQQLQPLVSGGHCQQFCNRMPHVDLETVYRTSDERQLLFLSRIRDKQPTRQMLMEYFEDRYWPKLESLTACVARGMEIGKQRKQHFHWLCITNAGASQVCLAALRHIGVSEADLASGYLCDPTTKSELRILARPGLLIRLSRNFDKQRGFVNGALAEVCESLRGNSIFIARLVGSGNMVLVHPMEEEGQIFLPCSYGYGSTIRRSQGADLDLGCIYFDQKMPAGRGYGYVAVSRFKSRAGCFLYGKMRRTDFLPVGEVQTDEVLERDIESQSSDEDDGCGLEYAFSEGDECISELGDEDGDSGHQLVDFI